MTNQSGINRWGTSNFPSEQAAFRYYKKQFEDTTKDDICSMIKSNEITIGRPKVSEGQVVVLNEEEERYFITEYKK